MISDLVRPALTSASRWPDELLQEAFFFLRVPVGLLHRAAPVADRAEGAARRVGAQLVGLRVGMLEDFPGLEIEEFLVADILQHQRLLAVADDDPIALADFQLGHAYLCTATTSDTALTAAMALS